MSQEFFKWYPAFVVFPVYLEDTERMSGWFTHVERMWKKSSTPVSATPYYRTKKKD